MHFSIPLPLLLCILTTSAAPSGAASRPLLPHKHLLRSDCPIAYPTPRASPQGTEPPYPIQITITAANSSNTQDPDDSGQDDDGQSTDSDTDGDDATNTRRTLDVPPTPGPQPQSHPPPPSSPSQPQPRTPPPPPPPLELCFAPPSNTSSAGGGPCTLALDLSSPDAHVSGAATVDVHALDGADAGSLVGSARFEAGAMVVVGDSFGCSDGVACFRFEGQEGEAAVGFLQGGEGEVGLVLRYGC